jgi:serine/threonine protein kinase
MSSEAGLPVGTVVGDLEIRGAIGRGGFGLVYEAHDPGLAIEVALKEYFLFGYSRRDGLNVLPQDESAVEVFEAGKARFIREARLLAMLHERAVGRTESLVRVLRVFQAHNTAYMVMRLYRGQTLRWHIKEKAENLTQEWLVGVMLPLLDALESLHSLPGESLVHRDVSPENIIILPSGVPVLLDFGAARDSRQEMTAVIYRVGYSPIELYTDVYPSGPWTDLYSLCSIAYFAVCNQLPLEAFERLAGKKMPLAVERGAGRFSEQVLKVIDKGMMVFPDDRYKTAAELRQALVEACRPSRPPVEFAAVLQADDDRTRIDTVSRFASTGAAPLGANPGFTSGHFEQAPGTRSSAPVQPPPGNRKSWIVWAGAAAALMAVIMAMVLLTKADRSPTPAIQTPPLARSEAPGVVATTAVQSPVPQTPAGVAASLPGLDCARAVANWGCVLEGLSRTAAAAAGTRFELSKKSAEVGEAIDAIVRSEQGGYVYLFSVEDTPQGHLAVVFPNAFDSVNQISAGATMRLPRRPIWDIQAMSPLGPSWFIVVVTSEVVPGWRAASLPPVALERLLAGFEASDPWAALGLQGCTLAAGTCKAVRAVIPVRFEVR